MCVTPLAHRLLDEQVAASRMSRGDYIEYLLREKSGLIDEALRAAVAGASIVTEIQPTTPSLPEQVETVVAPPQPVADWSFNG